MLPLPFKIIITIFSLNSLVTASIKWERFKFEDKDAFILMPKKHSELNIPWVFYAPTLRGLPNERDEGWMINHFLGAGIAVAGIDVGESYGNIEGRNLYSKFHNFLTQRKKFNPKACLLARSRGGLMLYNWAANNPKKVKCIAGIYPVCNLRSYPGLERAAPAYKMSASELANSLSENNPINRLQNLAKADVPIFHIHGNVDTVVPLKSNSGIIAKRYQRFGGNMQLVVPKGQGHNMWEGFFKCDELVNFIINCAKENKVKPPKAKLLWKGGKFTEGPSVSSDGSVYFSDVGANSIYKYNPKTTKVTNIRPSSGRANGIIFDHMDRLIACEGANTEGRRRISITKKDGSIITLTDNWKGKRLNSPNDLAINKRNKLIYFTDPRYVGNEERELDFEGIFMVDLNGNTSLATKDIKKPNGILVSEDGKTIFVADHEIIPNGSRKLLSFSIEPNGELSNKKVLHDFEEERGIDGMALSPNGDIYATAGSGKHAGIYVFSHEGDLLRFIPTPGDPTNCTFGHGKNQWTLYVTAQSPRDGETRTYALYELDLIE